MEIIELLQKLNQEGKTIIMVTHEPNIAKFAGKRLYMLDGKIQKVEG
jgi:putative ABC transport system ATP-binding protein